MKNFSTIFKTTFLSFHTPHNIPISSPRILLQSSHIIRSSSIELLGLTLTETLDWTPHIQKISSKIISSCYMLRKLSYIVPPDITKIVYFAHVHSHLAYGILFWGASPQAKRIFILQKKAVRILTWVSSRHSCRDLFKQVGVLTLTGILIQAAATFVRINSSIFTQNSQIHDHMTRSSRHIHLATHNLSLFSKGPYYLSSIIYNKLPDKILSSSSDSIFKHNLKSFLIDKSFYSLQEFLTPPPPV